MRYFKIRKECSFKRKTPRLYRRGWWGVFFKRAVMQIFAKRAKTMSTTSNWFLINNTGSHRFSFFIGKTAAVSSRVRRLLIARLKRKDAADRPVIRAWVKLGKKHFFCKKGHNQRMGKGVGSSLTSRRVFRPGELVFLFSSNTFKSIHSFISYIKTRLNSNLIISVWSKYFGINFLGKSQRGFSLIRETRPSVTGVEYRNTRRAFSKKINLYLRSRSRRRIKNKITKRLQKITLGLAGRCFKKELLITQTPFQLSARVRYSGRIRCLRQVLPTLKLQISNSIKPSPDYCKFVIPSTHTYDKPTCISFLFKTPQNKFIFKLLLKIFITLTRARKLKNINYFGADQFLN